jgi:hypothetical protein
MKAGGLCLIVLALLPVAARGDLSIVQKVEGSSSVSQITIKIKGDKARVEVTPRVTTIVDRKSGDMLTLINAEKKYVRISADKSKAIAELASKYAGDSTAADAKLTPAGRK